MCKICFTTNLKEIGRHCRTAKISKKTLIVSNKVVKKNKPEWYTLRSFKCSIPIIQLVYICVSCSLSQVHSEFVTFHIWSNQPGSEKHIQLLAGTCLVLLFFLLFLFSKMEIKRVELFHSDYKSKAFNLLPFPFISVGMVLNATKHPESWKPKWVAQWLICSQSRQAVASVH